MERVNRIIKDPLWKEKIAEIRKFEAKRRFCGHGMYAAALLHDIGRGEEYRNGTPHEIAGQEIAREIAERAGFTNLETDAIVFAIGKHRDESVRDEESIAGLLYRADKKSRICCLCPVEKECGWSDEKKNMSLTV